MMRDKTGLNFTMGTQIRRGYLLVDCVAKDESTPRGLFALPSVFSYRTSQSFHLQLVSMSNAGQ